MHLQTYLIILTTASVSLSLIRDTSFALLSRRKRALVYQEGLNWVQMVIGIGLPVEVKDTSITIGAAVKSYYELPNNSTYYTDPIQDLERRSERRKRSTSRWDLYYAIESFAERFGFKDGKSCLLKMICETSKAPFDKHTGLFAEVMHIMFTPSSTNEPIENRMDSEYHSAEKVGKEVPDCGRIFYCDADFMSRFSQLMM